MKNLNMFKGKAVKNQNAVKGGNNDTSNNSDDTSKKKDDTTSGHYFAGSVFGD